MYLVLNLTMFCLVPSRYVVLKQFVNEFDRGSIHYAIRETLTGLSPNFYLYLFRR